MSRNNEYVCRICGFVNDDITWEDGIYPSYNICPCCGVEFGYEDSDLVSIKNYRDNWLSGGANWFRDIGLKRENWDLLSQLNNIPEVYR